MLLANTVSSPRRASRSARCIGTAAAWLVERTDLPGRRVLHVLLAAPLAVPAFVNSYGWISLTPQAARASTARC